MFDQGRSQDFLKGWGVTLWKWGYSPDCHVVLVACCRLFALKKLTKGGGGGSQAAQDPPGYASVFDVGTQTRTTFDTQVKPAANNKHKDNNWFDFEIHEKETIHVYESNHSIRNWQHNL